MLIPNYPHSNLELEVKRKLYPEVLDILKLYPTDVIVAGGAIRAILAREHITDVDLYVTEEDVQKQIVKNLIENHEFKVVSNTVNSITLVKPNKVIQIISKIYIDAANPAELFDHFDFTITMALYSQTYGLLLAPTFLQDLASRTLYLQNPSLKYPISTLVRTLKYKKYGYHVSPLLLVLISLQINTLKIDTFADLKDQLQGIDTTIFDVFFEGVDPQMKFSLDVFNQRLLSSYFDSML